MTNYNKYLLPCVIATSILIVSGCQSDEHAHADKTHSSGIISEELLKTTHSWDGALYPPYLSGQPELRMLKITLPAHTTMAWHYHPVANAAYVQSGTLTVEKKPTKEGERGEMKTFQSGQVVPETVGNVHRGITGDSAVVLIVTYSGEEGTPITVPESQMKK